MALNASASQGYASSIRPVYRHSSVKVFGASKPKIFYRQHYQSLLSVPASTILSSQNPKNPPGLPNTSLYWTPEDMSQRMHDSIAGVEAILGYHFNDSFPLWEALQAPGSGVFSAGTRQITGDGNKRMAVVGDSWMRSVIVMDWFRSGKPRVNGAQVVEALLSNKNLDKVGRLYGLDKFINSNPSQFGVISPRTMADTMEAIMGAVVEDGREEALRAVMGRLGLLAVPTDS